MELMRWSTLVEDYGMELRKGSLESPATDVFGSTEEGERRWTDLKNRVVEHVSAGPEVNWGDFHHKLLIFKCDSQMFLLKVISLILCFRFFLFWGVFCYAQGNSGVNLFSQCCLCISQNVSEFILSLLLLHTLFPYIWLFRKNKNKNPQCFSILILKGPLKNPKF